MKYALLCLPGGLLILGALELVRYLRRRAERAERLRILKLIRTKRAKRRWIGMDEGLRERTAKRRQAAEGMRARAAHVDSGASVGDVLRIVRR